MKSSFFHSSTLFLLLLSPAALSPPILIYLHLLSFFFCLVSLSAFLSFGFLFFSIFVFHRSIILIILFFPDSPCRCTSSSRHSRHRLFVSSIFWLDYIRQMCEVWTYYGLHAIVLSCCSSIPYMYCKLFPHVVCPG